MSRCIKPPAPPEGATDSQKYYYENVVLRQWRECLAGEREDKIYGRVKEDTEKRLDREDARQQAILNAEEERNKRRLDFDTKVYESDLAFRKSTLRLEGQRLKDESQYRNRLLAQQTQQFNADLAERQRVRADTKEQFTLELQQKKDEFAKTLAFNKATAAENNKRRIQADRLAEEGARRQVLSSLGYHNKNNRVSSPLESLMKGLQLQRNNRQRLNTV